MEAVQEYSKGMKNHRCSVRGCDRSVVGEALYATERGFAFLASCAFHWRDVRAGEFTPR